MRRLLSLPGLAVAVWVTCLGFIGLLAGMLVGRAWHPHFLPVTVALALVVASAVGLVVVASWRIVRGPGRRRALAWLLIGSAPLWFLGGHLLYGAATQDGRQWPLTVGLKLLMPLAESLMDLEARFRYPQRTHGEKVVMISAPMPEDRARAQVAAMDRHVRAVEARLGRRTIGMIHWARGPLMGAGGRTVFGLCMGSRPGDEPADAEGLCTLDRHEVAHCVYLNQCPVAFDAPAVLTEGWAEANQGTDPLEQAGRVWQELQYGSGFTLRRLVAPDWYARHDWPVYNYGAPLVSFLLRRLGPEKFIELYTTCRQSTFESDCRRVLGLDVDGLDAAFRADLERRIGEAGSLSRRRLERLRLGPAVKADDWKAFLAEYFAAADRLLAPYRHARLDSAWTRTEADGQGRISKDEYEEHLLRSGDFAIVRHRWTRGETAVLAHPRRSIIAHRESPDRPWKVDDGSKRPAEAARRRALERIDGLDRVRWGTAPLAGLADHLWLLASNDQFLVTALDRFDEDGESRVRVRIEDHSPDSWQVNWHAATYVLAADDLFVPRTELYEGLGYNRGTSRSGFTYDRHDGIPVLRAERNTMTAPGGTRSTRELRVVARHFGPIPEEEFDPDRFLDGPQEKLAPPNPDPYPGPGPSTLLARWYWLPFPIGALGLIGGVLLSLAAGRDRGPLARSTQTEEDMSKTIMPIVVGILGLAAGSSPARAERISAVDDGTIRIGVDLDLGGTITLLSRSKEGQNLINSHDLGRQVQQSYYAGPRPFGKAHPGWKNWPWNPIGSGDVYNHPSRVVEHSNDGKTLYSRVIPMQWALDNVPGECTFETWITLDGAAARVRCWLNNNRPDRTQYPAQDQELPAVYTIGKLHRLFTYDGDRPFEGQPLRQIQNDGPPWASWKATENWAALVDDRGVGVGVIHPGVHSFIGGFHGKPDTGGPKDDPTGYIAPVRQEILDHNIVYEYRYILAVGTLDEIRAAATANRIKDTRPDDRFDHDRRHWIYRHARDAGFPISGGLRIRTTGEDPQWIGPERWWRAEEMPKLFIRAAFRTRGDRVHVFWSAPGQGFRPEHRVELTVRPDGELRTYEVDLAAAPGYRGTITGLRIDPPDADGPNEEIRIESISWRPE